MTKKKWVLFLMLLLAMVVAGTAVYASVDGITGYAISRSVVAGGGNQGSTGGSYSLSGTAGQTAVSSPATSGSYTLTSGFWNGNNSYAVYLPAIIK